MFRTRTPHDEPSSSHAGGNSNAAHSHFSKMTVRATIGPFDVKSPPIKQHKVGGRMVPTMRAAAQFLNVNRRRISLEILRPSSENENGTVETATEVLPWNPENEVIEDEDLVILRIYYLTRKPNEKEGGAIESDDMDNDNDDEISVASAWTDDGTGSGKVWRDRKHYRSDDVELTKVNGKVIEFKLGSGNEIVLRDFRFDTPSEAIRFRDAMERLKTLESERAARQISKYKGLIKDKKKKGSISTSAVAVAGGELIPSPLSVSQTIVEGEDEEEGGDQINLLVEIVSATDIPVADITSTDAYVIVRLRGKELHRTGVVGNNLSPIWTIATGSLFLIEMTPDEFFSSSSGLSFILKDYDVVGSNEILGSVNLAPEVLLAGTGKRTCFDIAVHEAFLKNIVPDKTPKLNLRFKIASKGDIEFMHELKSQNQKKMTGIFADETFVAIGKPDIKLMQRMEKKGAHKGEELYRVRPAPDPDRPANDTQWMTKAQIHEEALKPSTRWVKTSSGDIGTLYLEVIGCDKLPNMDTGTLNMYDKTDAFACIVFEDCIVNTDVIANTLSPRWMPWSQRAFAISISHPSSDVFIGFFDHDPELSPLQLASRATTTVHDPIGRLVINTDNFTPGTTYLLDYNLYLGELEEHRTSTRGTVTLRLRLEFKDLRKAMIRGIFPPHQTTVSVARRIDYDIAHFTTDGIVDDEKYSLTTLTRHLSELESYTEIVGRVTAAMMTVWLWRGHYQIVWNGKLYYLPLHSMAAYIWALLVSWNWDVFPSFCVFCVGWSFLAMNEQMRDHPSRWHKVPSYFDLAQRLIYNEDSPENVPSNANIDRILAHEEIVRKKKKRLLDEKKKMEENEAALQMELGQDLVNAEKAEQLGKKDGLLVGLDPLRPILFPIQQQLRDIVVILRIARCIFTWNEAYYAFWITTACFALSLAFLFIPWTFLWRWLLRILVLVGLGPWMAIVDKKYFTKEPQLTERDRDEAFEKRLKNRYDEVLLSSKNYFQRKERAMKLKAMKKYLFGNRTLKVPIVCEDLFPDTPLPSSSCSPFDPLACDPIEMAHVKFGQTLKGDMIPQREIQITSTFGKKVDPRKKWNRFLRKK